ncbi:MAG: septal ring lytic transglycosylase RlpA family protein [Cyanobacteria bacterium P01_D01_bin.105]
MISKNSAKQQLTSSLAAAVLLSGLGATVTSAQTLSTSPEVEGSTQFTPVEAVASNPAVDGLTEVDANEAAIAPTGALESAQTDLAPALSSDIVVHAHEIDGRSAATLYVKDIPLLTFIGTEVDSLSKVEGGVSLALSGSAPVVAGDVAAGGAAGTVQDPVIRASSLGEKLGDETIEADDISVRWHEESDGYIVTLAGDDLVELDSRTVLPDTTEDVAEDALQVTNRLRRLLGDAEPVSEIEGLPEPEPEPVAAAEPQQVAIVSSNVGNASWYGPGFHGRMSANGEIFNQNALTAAHRTLPFGTYVRVTNLYNGAAVTVRINDRGPYAGDRIIDLSAAAADVIGLTGAGVGPVQVDVLGY